MKKILSTLLALAMLVSLTAFAEEAPTVHVSISTDTGALVLAYAPVALTDADGDGALTICDALMLAHEVYCPEGAEGFLAEDTEWGKSLYVLWGVDNGGSYGYMLNDASPLSLLDAVKDGDHVKAYAFTDLTNFSDAYAFFSIAAATVELGDAVELYLYVTGYDENWNPVVKPLADATVVIDGTESFKTDENGRFSVVLLDAGVHTISAVSNDLTLVPPVCIVTVTE